MANNTSDKYKTIDEYINQLIDNGLKVESKTNLRNHLKYNNFTYCVEHFNKYFINPSTKKYYDDVTENDLIDLFVFNSKLSTLILQALLEIERSLCTSISQVLSETFSNEDSKKFIGCMERGLILQINDKDLGYMMRNHDKINRSDIHKELTNYAKRETELIKKYRSYGISKEECAKNIPIWVLCNYWTYGTIVKILEYVNKYLRIKILRFYFNVKPDKRLDNTLANYSKDVINMFRIIRNRVCHSSEVYNIIIKEKDVNINKVLDEEGIRDKDITSRTITIYEVIELILFFLQNKQFKNNFKQGLESICKQHISSHVEKECWKSLINQTKLFKYIK